MQTKAFVALLIVLVVWGGTVGAAFAGGVAMGKGKAEGSATPVVAPRPSPTPQAQATGQTPGGGPGFFQGQDGAPLSQDQLDQLRQQFQNRQGAGGGAQASSTPGAGGSGALLGRGGLAGIVDRIEGSTITITTAQGPLTAKIGTNTTVEVIATGTLASVTAGARVQVTGQRDADGTLQARTITVVPESLAGLLGNPGGRAGGTGQ
ncbi:MAG: hypothetical protein HY680_03055 [Chloroflexi bacterium]|nr:hypothetical protein [Chloroflexota bacterium]